MLTFCQQLELGHLLSGEPEDGPGKPEDGRDWEDSSLFSQELGLSHLLTGKLQMVRSSQL